MIIITIINVLLLQNLFLSILICLLNIHTKFAAVACLVEGQFLPARENRVVSNIMAGNPQTVINQGRTKFLPMKV